MTDVDFQRRVIVALLWLSMCILAKDSRAREIMMLGTVVLLALTLVTS